MSAPDAVDIFKSYRASLQKTPLREKTEHTDRDAIKTLLQQFTPSGITIVHEPKRVAGAGAPDFKIRQNGQIVGYVETKAIGTDLRELKLILKTDQIERYRSLSQNIILTDYLNWIWLKNGNIQTGTLCGVDELQNRKFHFDPTDIKTISGLLSGFLSVPPQKIARAHDLADALANRGRLLRDFLGDELIRQDRHGQGGRLYGLYSAFRIQVSETITLPEFADAFAQTLSYGLFLSKLNANGHSLGLTNAKNFIPKSFKLIQELVSFLDVLDTDDYNDIRWVVDEILSAINGLDVPSIKNDLSFKNRKGRYRSLAAKDEEEWRLFSRDPFIYFYEDYLAQYDDKLRKCRGVYYTPPPVVNFIVRAIDEVLKQTFDLKDGVADHKRVTVLDFACGTGTFVVELIERIIENVGSSSAKVELLIKDHVLKNIFAFEYLIAPYTIAHLKLSQYLEDRQIKLGPNDRFNILLTNTLEPLDAQQNFLLPALSEETKNALAVKNNPILVITGNPPYSGHSLNKGAWITKLIRTYRNGIPELSKPGQGKWLQDDYVKFIRFAQYKMDSVPEGVVAIITNSSYLDNPTFRGMRKSLTETFDQIYILDLHGSSKKEERVPDGLHDENVFDIQQGVAIALFVKKPGAERGVWRCNLWGTRIEKYRALSEASFANLKWETLTPAAPFFLFTKWNLEAAGSYNKYWSVRDIFSRSGDPAPGIVTTHDEFAISFTPKEAAAKVASLLKTRTEAEARKIFRLCSQSQWNYENAKADLSRGDYASNTRSVLYRPFDQRWTIWDSNVAVHRRERVMRQMDGENIGLVTCRQVVGREWQHAYVTNQVTDDSLVSNRTKERGYLFPLYINSPGTPTLVPHREGRIENFGVEFRSWLDERYGHKFTAEEIFGFVYATLYSEKYRVANADFLRMDFPRIPFPEKRSAFKVISDLGWDLTKKHLLKELAGGILGEYRGSGDHVVERPRYVAEEGAVYINAGQYFAPIPEDIWECRIGSHRIIEAFLKARKSRTLSLTEIDTVANIANVIDFTIKQVTRIDEIYGATF